MTAVLLFSLAGTGLYTGFTQALKAKNRIQEIHAAYDRPRIFFLRLEKDLRNAVALRDYPFQGKKDEISFPAVLHETTPEGRQAKLYLIRYFLRENELIRSEERLPRKLVKETPREKILLKGVSTFEFQFPYKDMEENRSFEPFWLEEPYYGIPKAVKAIFVREGTPFSKLVSIPQGKVGRIQNE